MSPGFQLRNLDHEVVKGLIERFAHVTCECVGEQMKIIDTKLFGDGDASMMCRCPRCNRIHMYGCYQSEGKTVYARVN